MAPKKPSTQKQPEDKIVNEEDEDSSSEEQGSSSEEEASSSSEEEKDQSQSAFKTPPPSTPISNPKPASESESESGSDSGSDSGSESETDTEPEPTPTPPPSSNVKPLASKPMKAQTQSQTTPVPARSGTKRSAENVNDSNRSKKKTTAGGGSDDDNETEEDVKLTGEDSKKTFFHRIFSEEDELTILKALADFISETGKHPLKDATAFHSFVKNSLSAEVNSGQLKMKVRRMKKKFESSDNFSKPHDKKAFELFKKICWGNNGANEAEENGKVSGKIAKGVKKEAPLSVKKELVVASKKESVVDNSLILSELIRFYGHDAGGFSVLNKDSIKRGLELIEESKRVEFQEQWNQVQIAEMELLLRRSRLIKDQSKLLAQAIKKSSK